MVVKHIAWIQKLSCVAIMHLQSLTFHLQQFTLLNCFIFLGIFLLLSYENYNTSKRGFTAKAFCCGNDEIRQLLEKPDGKTLLPLENNSPWTEEVFNAS